MRTVLFAIGTLFLGLIAGFFLGRQCAPLPASGEIIEQEAVLTNINTIGIYDTYYPRSFSLPPALEIIDDTLATETTHWSFKVTGQRSDGFRIHVTVGGGVLNKNPLRYLAKGRVSQ